MKLPLVGLTMGLLIFMILAWSTVDETLATAGPQQVGRVFYLANASPPRLDTFPPGGGVPSIQNVTKAPLDFNLQSPLQCGSCGVTISSPMIFTLWLHSNATAGADVQLEGTFHEKFGTNPALNLTSFATERIPNTSLTRLNFSFSIPTQVLLPFAQIGVSFRIPNPPARTLIQVFYASSTTPSGVVITLSSYLTPDEKGLQILDIHALPTTTFDLRSNSTTPNTAVVLQVAVRSAFGTLDVTNPARANVTIVAPSGTTKVVKNVDMGLPFGTQNQPFVFVYPWVVPQNSTVGIYTVYLDLVDSQNSIAFSLGPATFTITRGLFIPPSLIPYFAVGGASGAGALGGLVYYRRRKAKSYLVPFDYFTTLTGGGINGGTVVTIEGNTGSGKTVLSQELMFEDLKNGRPCVFVATGDFPPNVRAGMKSLGMDVTGYEQSGLLTFVDGYSSEAGQESREKFAIPSLADLTTVGVKISSSLPSGSFKGGSLYFDSLTPLVPKAKPESIVSLVQSMGARVKGMSGKAFFTVGPSVDPSVQRQLEELSDCVVQMEAFEERGVRKSRLRIAKYRARRYQQGWALYTIEDGKGMIFYSKKAQK